MLQDEEAQRRSEAQRAELQRQDEARRADLRRAEEEQMRLAAQRRADAEVHAQRLAQLQQERMAAEQMLARQAARSRSPAPATWTSVRKLWNFGFKIFFQGEFLSNSIQPLFPHSHPGAACRAIGALIVISARRNQ